MKFAILALAASAMAVPVPQESGTSDCANKIVQSLNDASAQMNATRDATEEFSHGLLDIGALLKVQCATTDLGKKIKATTDVVNSCSQLDETSSVTVSQATLNMLPLINSTLSLIVEKKPEFDKAILDFISAGFVVKSDLKSLNSSTADLSTAIQSHLADELQPAVDSVITQIVGWFNDAIQAYS